MSKKPATAIKKDKITAKGGLEVLQLVSGVNENLQYDVELILEPRCGPRKPPAGGSGGSFSDRLTSGLGGTNQMYPCYSFFALDLPKIPDSIQGDYMQVWECYMAETEVVGATQLLEITTTTYEGAANMPGKGSVGAQLYFWAVGGDPLDVIGVQNVTENTYPAPLISPTAKTDYAAATSNKTKVVQDGVYPVTCWSPWPGLNDNCKYYGKVFSGNTTPSMVQFGNSSTVLLLDKDGVGIICKGRCYVYSCDCSGQERLLTDGSIYRHKMLSRWFRLHFRKRWIQNPFALTDLYNKVLSEQPTVSGQSNEQALQEVTITQGEDDESPRIDTYKGQSLTKTVVQQ